VNGTFDWIDITLWILAFALLGAAIVLIRWWRKPRPELPAPLTPPEDLILEPVFLRFHEPVPFHTEDPRVEAQHLLWRQQMLAAGRVLTEHRVRNIIFLHGTFAGSDPLDILPTLRSALPRLHQRWEEKLQRRMKKAVDVLARDNGNFLPQYVRLVEDALGGGTHCQLFHWSSANHHIGRLLGAIRLIDVLVHHATKHPGDRILLIGHSHARQLFALFTHLLGQSVIGRRLWEFLQKEDLITSTLDEQAASLRAMGFDFVTLGGPVRYPWAFLKDMRALHFINHRGEGLTMEKPLGFWNTAAGDYMQQWGTIGSDTLATTSRERAFNRQLDEILGKGTDTRLWLHAIARRERLGNFGRTLLIDYADQGRGPNFIGTVFGHGVYTRYRALLFHMQQICRYLYDNDITSR
jgi:hypothetical protein